MKRFAMEKLIEWKNSKYRKPLIVRGARQVGKTWLLKEFGKIHYENIAYFNFDENIEYKQFFQQTKDIQRILPNLSMASGQVIKPKQTLIIFDEIQECYEALNTLKYFHENAPQYHVVCAGSLLGISLSKSLSFPVGKVDFISLYPMTFFEFLIANKKQNLVDYINSIDKISAIPDAFLNPLYENLKMYFITGGMPESIKIWVNELDSNLVQQILSNIIDAYERDFSKHAPSKDYPKLSLIWNSIPSQLSRENKKFLYSVVKKGARAREYENALQWLHKADLIYKVYRSSTPKIPLSAYDDLTAYKIYLLDVGLLRRLSHLSTTAFAEGNRLFTEFKGALTENYILQSLSTQYEVPLRYWAINNPNHEIDFLLQKENDIFPVEVKAGNSINSKSLKKFSCVFSNEFPLKIRFSMKNLALNGDILNIPLILADYTDSLIEIALKTKNIF